MSALGHSLRLARVDVLRMYRTQTNWRGGSASVVGTLMYAVLIVAGTAGAAYLGRWLGSTLVAGGVPGLGALAPVQVARGILALLWLMITLVYAVRAVGERGSLSQSAGVLTAVPTREALLGVLLAEYAYYLMWLFPPSLGLGAGLALGAGAATPLVVVPAAAAAAGAASVAVGYPLGLAIRHVASRIPFVARHKGAIVVLVFVSYFVALSTGAWNDLMVRLVYPLQRSPPGWFADLAFLGTPAMAASAVRAAGAVSLAAVLGVLAVAGGTRIADRHWFSDPATGGGTRSESGGTVPGGFDRRLAPYLGGATASLVVLSWRRARRSPLKLLYAFYPLLLVAGLFADIVRTGRVPAYLPFAVALFGAWAAGVVFTLNPLGDQGAALSATLLSHVDGRTFVRAHVVASLAVAVPLGTLATAAVALASPVSAGTALALVLATPVAMVVSSALSVGVGTAFPRFEATSVSRSMETVLPSRWAFVLFSLHLFATAAAGAVVYDSRVADLGAVLVTWLLPFGLTVSPGILTTVAAAALVPLLLAPFVAYRYAIRRFDRYTLP